MGFPGPFYQRFVLIHSQAPDAAGACLSAVQDSIAARG